MFHIYSPEWPSLHWVAFGNTLITLGCCDDPQPLVALFSQSCCGVALFLQGHCECPLITLGRCGLHVISVG